MSMRTAIFGRRLGGALLLGLATVLPVAAAEPSATDRVRLDRTVISGNQELPKVLYILPWESKETRPALAYGLVADGSDVLRRVYPGSHRRQLDQIENLKHDAPGK